jgi:hypothetical protein
MWMAFRNFVIKIELCADAAARNLVFHYLNKNAFSIPKQKREQFAKMANPISIQQP